MNTMTKQARQRRVRAKLHGTAARPRLSVIISLKHVSAQLIDDDAHVTLASVTTTGKQAPKVKTMTDKATWAGEQIAVAAKSKKITTVIFDRGSKLYHGRVQAFADAARENGLQF